MDEDQMKEIKIEQPLGRQWDLSKSNHYTALAFCFSVGGPPSTSGWWLAE